MSKSFLTQNTKLDLSQVTVLLNSGSVRETDVLMQIFVGFGARTRRRADSLEALIKSLESEPIDLVVIDAASGWAATLDAVRRMRRMPNAWCDAPVVLTTANVLTSMLAEARDAGVSYVVSKPMTPAILFERLLWLAKESRHFIRSDGYCGPDRRVRALGPPCGHAGRRSGDLSAEVGEAKSPNMTQSDIDSIMIPVRKAIST